MTKKGGQKYYVVWKGAVPGVYTTWEECAAQVVGFSGAQYKSFPTENEALLAFQHQETYKTELTILAAEAPLKMIKSERAYCVDASCIGNPGVMEYQCVEIPTMRTIFKSAVYQNATNNIGEFLAIVHALALMEKNNDKIVVFSDSRIAISWVKSGKCKTDFQPDEHLQNIIQRAEKWLFLHPDLGNIYKWDTELWGEIPADFGRK